MSQFTWWRRFWPTQKLAPQQFYKGGSKLLQRIEFGEFEFEPLSSEVLLEEEIYRLKCEEIDALEGYHPDTLNDMKITERKKKNKRVNVMLSHHLDWEQNRLHELVLQLAKEFNVEIEFVYDTMETFDGTTRELYFHIKAIAENREPKTSEEVLMFPRMQVEQSRHILKPKQKKYEQTWTKIVQNKKVY